jgi:hypothetical protein
LPATNREYPKLAPTRARAVGLAVAVFLFFFAAYTFTLSGDIFSTGDTTIRIQLAENIGEHFRLDLHGWTVHYANHVKKEQLDPRVSTGRGGLTYTTYELGQPLAFVPLDYFAKAAARQERWPQGAAQLWFDRLVGPIFGALEVLVFFLFAVRLGFGLRRAIPLTLVFAFATGCWPDEQSVLEHTEVAFFILLGVYLAFRYRDQDAGSRYVVFSGLGLGGALMTRYQDAFLAFLATALYLALPRTAPWRWRDMFSRAIVRDEVLLSLGLLPAVVVDMWYSVVRFGSPLATGHYEKLFGYPIWLGAPGLLVSPGKGLLWYSPTIFLLVFAVPAFFRRFRDLTVTIGALAVGFVLLYANVTFWHGDPAWGPRYMYPVVPFLTLPLGELFYLRRKHTRLILAISALVVAGGFTIQLSAVAVSQWRTWYKVIAYEGAQGHQWQWIASRYRYFWNVHESPLDFQVRGLYQMAYDTVFNSQKYELVPPNEDPVLDKMTVDYAINEWNFWWTSNEFNWWLGEDKIALLVVALLSVAGASATYVAAEAVGAFDDREFEEPSQRPIPEAA